MKNDLNLIGIDKLNIRQKNNMLSILGLGRDELTYSDIIYAEPVLKNV